MKYETNPRRKNGAMRLIITAFAPLVSGSALPELWSRIHEQQRRGLSLFRLLLTCCKHIRDECNCQANLWEFVSAQANRFLANAAETFLQFGSTAGAVYARVLRNFVGADAPALEGHFRRAAYMTAPAIFADGQHNFLRGGRGNCGIYDTLPVAELSRHADTRFTRISGAWLASYAVHRRPV